LETKAICPPPPPVGVGSGVSVGGAGSVEVLVGVIVTVGAVGSLVPKKRHAVVNKAAMNRKKALGFFIVFLRRGFSFTVLSYHRLGCPDK